jgi:hypothetical protein
MYAQTIEGDKWKEEKVDPAKLSEIMDKMSGIQCYIARNGMAC